MRDIVLFCVDGYQHLEAAQKLASVVKDAGKKVALFYAREVDSAERFPAFEHHISDPRAVLGYFKRVSLAITFTNETSPHCATTNLVSYAARMTNTSVATIQHGWLQPGLTYESGLQKVGFARGADNSNAMAHFSEQIRWEGDEGIGYFALEEGVSVTLPKPMRDQYYALICTNLNSTIYSQEQTFQFLRCISRLKDAFPYLKFFHRGHPAEDTVVEFQKLGMMDLAPYLMHSPSSPYPMNSSLIGMDFVITTPSTSALDCIAAGVPVFLFEEKNFIGKMDAFNGALFRTHEQLIKLVRDLISNAIYPTPTIKPFSKENFLTMIEREESKTKPFVMTEKIMLDFYARMKTVI